MVECGFKQQFFAKASLESKSKCANGLKNRNSTFAIFLVLYVNAENEK